MKGKVPIIALVGQANVGKSSLFNLLLKSRRNIVAREAGTTRDSISELIELKGKTAWLTDTAGLKAAEDDFEMTIQDQIEEAIATADVICLLVEADKALDQKDRQLAKKALKSGKEIVLAVNKLDLNLKARPEDFLKLGIKDVFLLSTTTKRGVGPLIDHLEGLLPAKNPRPETDVVKVALLGRPNVGKSSLFNCLVKKQQALVSERARTTRDVNRRLVKFEKQALEFLDTAGIRRSGKIERGVEKFSVLRTLAAIEESDVCLVLIDANELVTALEQKIAGLADKAAKGLILVVSKWDSLEDKSTAAVNQLKARLKKEFSFIPWAGLIFTSAQTGQNVSKIFGMVLEIMQRRQQKISTSQLNRCLQKAVNHHPPAGLKNTHPRLNYAVQTLQNPPTFQFFGSFMQYLHWSYKRFLERCLREEFDFSGTALVLTFKEKH